MHKIYIKIYLNDNKHTEEQLNPRLFQKSAENPCDKAPFPIDDSAKLAFPSQQIKIFMPLWWPLKV